jgi:hypothetical protein
LSLSDLIAGVTVLTMLDQGHVTGFDVIQTVQGFLSA